MKRFLLVLICVASVAAFGVAAATADGYTDPAGDANGGPDITAVTVTNDDAGTITMNIAVALPASQAMFVFMDTDLNGQVSDSTGKAILVVAAAPGVVMPVALANDASGNSSPMVAPSLKATATATTVVLTFAKTEFAIDKGLGFWIATLASPDQSAPSDEAPDALMYTYMLTTTPPPPPPAPVVVKPVIGAPTTVPMMPVAGKRLTVTFPVTRSDDGTALASGTMICDPSVAGKVIKHTESFKAGKARLSFVVPNTAKGKTVKVKLTIRATGQSASKMASFRIR